MSTLEALEDKAHALAEKIGTEAVTLEHYLAEKFHAVLDDLLKRADTEADVVKAEAEAAAKKAAESLVADASKAVAKI